VRSQQLLLTFEADLGQHDLAAITEQLLIIHDAKIPGVGRKKQPGKNHGSDCSARDPIQCGAVKKK
jgi:hypothetical protein